MLHTFDCPCGEPVTIDDAPGEYETHCRCGRWHTLAYNSGEAREDRLLHGADTIIHDGGVNEHVVRLAGSKPRLP